MTRGQFTYYDECQRISSFYRVPRHEVQFVARQMAKIYMVKDEIIEVIHAAAIRVAQDYNQPIPKRNITTKHIAKLKELSRELGREVVMAIPKHYKKVI